MTDVQKRGDNEALVAHAPTPADKGVNVTHASIRSDTQTQTVQKLGDGEALVAQVVWNLGENNAYGIPIMDSIRELTGREPALGALYTTLSRLEAKGILSSRMSDPTPQRGGRRRKLYEITGSGEISLSAKAMELEMKRSLLVRAG